MIRADLDHVAVAAEHVELLWPRYAGDLGGTWEGGGTSPGFYSAQVRYANGMKVEGLHPARVDDNDFLRRFLDHSGPGPHHLTFKVPDIRAALADVEGSGYHAVGVNLSDPGWQEAFLHPKQATGIVVQLAQSGEGGEWVPEPAPASFPTGPTATLVRVAHHVADLAEARRLFEQLLGGRPLDEGDGWVELGWPGPGRIRLSQVGPDDAWVGNRTGRLHHLAFDASDPAAVPGAVAGPGGGWVVPPEANLGVRLVLTPTA
jgi:methylmalonyl-CoA/ethylmalonyl-CoA epimerase